MSLTDQPTPAVIQRQQEELPATGEAERAPVPDLDEVVGEADRCAAERDEEDGQAGLRVAAQHEERHDHREHDQEAAHGRRPLLQVVPGRALLADVLAVLLAAKEIDELRAAEDRDRHREDGRREDSFH